MPLNPQDNDDAHRAAIAQQVENVQPEHGTPLGEAMQDIFEQGYTGHRNSLNNLLCRKNFVVVVTDGCPSSDNDWSRINGTTITDADHDGWTEDPYQYTNPPDDYYDDVSHYMYTHSWLDTSHPVISDPANSYSNVISHHISFGAVHPLLQDAASESGGQYLTAYNKVQLVSAFYSIALQMSNAVSFTAPVVSVDAANKVQNGNDLYMGLFLPEDNGTWIGNLKKFQYGDGSTSKPDKWMLYDNGTPPNPAINSDGVFQDNLVGFWDDNNDPNDSDNYGAFDIKEDGAGSVLLKRVISDLADSTKYWERNIYTYTGGQNGGALTAFNQSTISAAQLDVGNDDARNKLVNYIYGYTNDADTSGNPVAARDWVLGSIIHSQPVVVDYYDPSDNSKIVRRYVFVGANDGMLHVFDDTPTDVTADTNKRGSEIFAFIPGDLLTKLKKLPVGSSSSYADNLVDMVDGKSTLYRDSDSQPKYLIFGERRGGGVYWCLNIANYDSSQWNVKWYYTNPEIQQTWSTVRVAGIPVGVDYSTGNLSFQDVAIFTGGYDTLEDNFPEPFDDPDFNGTPFDNGNTPNNQEWNKTTLDADGNLKYDKNGNGIYDVYNPGSDNQGRGIFVVDIDNPYTSISTQDTTGNTHTILPFSASYGATLNASGNVQTFPDMKYCFPASPSVLAGTYNYQYKANVDGVDKYIAASHLGSLITIYATDVYGNIYRVNYDFKVHIDKGDPGDVDTWNWSMANSSGGWTVSHIFAANPGSDSSSGNLSQGSDDSAASIFDNGKKTFYAPVVSWGGSSNYFNKSNYYFQNTVFSGQTEIASLLFGTGDRAHPSYTMVRNRFYSVYDDSSVSGEQYDSDNNLIGGVQVSTVPNRPYHERDLENVTCDELATSSSLTQKNDIKTWLTDDATYNDGADLEQSVYENDAKGWYIVLQDQENCSGSMLDTFTDSTSDRDNHDGEKVLSFPQLYYGIVYFTTYQPSVDDPCNPKGNGFSYSLDYATGSAAYDLNLVNNVTKTTLDLSDRYMKYTGIYGIPSSFSLVFRDGEVSANAMMGNKLVYPKGTGIGNALIKNYPPGLIPYYWREGNSLE